MGVLAVVVIGLLILGIVLMVKAIQGIRDDLSAPAPEPTTAEPTAPGPADGEGSGTCPTDSVRVAASTDEDEYDVDEEPQLTIEVTNGHDADCLIDVGEAQQEFVIERDGDTVWSSRYCAATGEGDEAASNPLVFPAQSSKKASLTWPRVPVDDDCRQTDEAFPAGDYALIVKLGEAESEPATFTLAEDPDARSDDEETDAQDEPEGEAAGDGEGDDAAADG